MLWAIRRRSLAELALDYLSLTKPRIVGLLLATAVGPMFPAAHGWPALPRLVAVIIGGSLAAGGAGAINCWFDRDIDAAMQRTRRRPIPDGRIAASHALILGVVLNLAAFLVLLVWANLLAATLALVGTLIYVFVYTIWLKRSTAQNIVIGGAAGAMPPLVGWAAVTGRLDLTALSLFLIIFLWTPPHFWSLAQMIKADYSRVGIPMLPVVSGDLSAKRQSLVYTVLLLAVSLIPFFTHAAGSLYLAGAIVLGIGFTTLAALDLTDGTPGRRRVTRRLFSYSIFYLAGIFLLLTLAPFFG